MRLMQEQGEGVGELDLRQVVANPGNVVEYHEENGPLLRRSKEGANL